MDEKKVFRIEIKDREGKVIHLWVTDSYETEVFKDHTEIKIPHG